MVIYHPSVHVFQPARAINMRVFATAARLTTSMNISLCVGSLGLTLAASNWKERSKKSDLRDEQHQHLIERANAKTLIILDLYEVDFVLAVYWRVKCLRKICCIGG